MKRIIAQIPDEVENLIRELTMNYDYSLADVEPLVDELSVQLEEYGWDDLYDYVDDYIAEEGAGVDLVALYIGDGYLAGASRDDRADDIDYWPSDLWRTQDWELVILNDVPVKIAEELEAMGTTDQTIGDGYEAAEMASDYVGNITDSSEMHGGAGMEDYESWARDEAISMLENAGILMEDIQYESDPSIDPNFNEEALKGAVLENFSWYAEPVIDEKLINLYQEHFRRETGRELGTGYYEGID